MTDQRPRRSRRSSTSRMLAAQLPPSLRRYTLSGRRWRAGNQVRLLRAGAETFPAMLAAIEGATRSVCLETYILEPDLTGHRFAAALLGRAEAGVTVRLLYDAVGGLAVTEAYLTPLRAAGIEIVEYHPIAPWRRRWGLSQRDHRKVLVVDDEVAFTGGLNIGDEYADVGDGGGGWFDLHTEIRGPIVRDFALSFRRTWTYAGGTPYPAPAHDHADPRPPPGTGFAHLIDNALTRRRGVFRAAYLAALRHATTSVFIINAYFLPDRGLRRALRRAVERGVDVQVIVPGRSDVRLVALAGLYVQSKLVRMGVEIHHWRGVMMHAKAAVIDGTWATVGSYNLDNRSLFDNLEVAVETLDDDLAHALTTTFTTTLANTTPFDAASWRGLPWWRKVAAWVAFRLRRLL